MTKIKDQIALLKRIAKSKKQHKERNVQSGQITEEQATFEILLIEDAVQTLAALEALVR